MKSKLSWISRRFTAAINTQHTLWVSNITLIFSEVPMLSEEPIRPTQHRLDLCQLEKVFPDIFVFVDMLLIYENIDLGHLEKVFADVDSL